MTRLVRTTTLSFLIVVISSILVANVTTSSQNLEVVFYKLEIDSEPLRMIELPAVFDQCASCKLTDEEMQYLKSQGLTGQLHFRSQGVHGNKFGKFSRALIIMYRQPPPMEITRLYQPDGCNVIYTQTENGWDKYPKDARTTSLAITLSSRPEYPNQIIYSADLAAGGRQGGAAIIW
ncbi:MAG: hypothetical protein AB1757_18190 [Acidobacteriota bacterium]